MMGEARSPGMAIPGKRKERSGRVGFQFEVFERRRVDSNEP